MKFFKNIFLFLVILFGSLSLMAWHGEEIKISKGGKSISCTIRYYSNEELSENNLGLEELSCSRIFNPFFNANKYIAVARNHKNGIYFCGELCFMNTPILEDLYAKYKQILTEKFHSFLRLFELHNCWPEDPITKTDNDAGNGLIAKFCANYDSSGLILIASDQTKNKGEMIFNIYKTAMKKIAQEDVRVKYKESILENGKVIKWLKFRKYPNGVGLSINSNYDIELDNNLWTKLKNFVVNEKFLYAIAGLSALYFGYEYMNQK